jgi:DNA polymerase-4
MKKPDAVTVVSRENYRDTVWKLPVSDLLYVGPATTRKLARCCIYTIGDLARYDPELLRHKFGKNGIMLWRFANGADGAPVMPRDYVAPVKSVGHGTTCLCDLETDYEVWLVLYELAQDVGHRLRIHGITTKGVQLAVRDKGLGWYSWQMPLPYPSQSPYELAQAGFALFRERYHWHKPVRALTIRGINPGSEAAPLQTDMFNDYLRHEKRKKADDAVDEIRNRLGNRAVFAASLMGNPNMALDRCETVPMPNPMYR